MLFFTYLQSGNKDFRVRKQGTILDNYLGNTNILCIFVSDTHNLI